jgi:hypothetical protein
MEGGYVGHGTNIGCPRPKDKKTILLNQQHTKKAPFNRPGFVGAQWVHESLIKNQD